MKCLLAALALGLAAMQPASAQVNLNPPYGDPLYKAFTVFSPDASDPDAMRDDVMVVFHGFTSAVPNGTYKRVRKAFRETHTVIGINYDPLDVGRTLAFLDTVEKTWLEGRRTVVLGTSIGALWADVFGHRIGARRIIMLNPVTEPARQLSNYAGKQATNIRRARSFLVDAAALERYGSLKTREPNEISRLVVLSADDDVLDFRAALDVFAGKPKTITIVYPEGGHTLDLRKHPARASIVEFVSTP